MDEYVHCLPLIDCQQSFCRGVGVRRPQVRFFTRNWCQKPSFKNGHIYMHLRSIYKQGLHVPLGVNQLQCARSFGVILVHTCPKSPCHSTIVVQRNLVNLVHGDTSDTYMATVDLVVFKAVLASFGTLVQHMQHILVWASMGQYYLGHSRCIFLKFGTMEYFRIFQLCLTLSAELLSWRRRPSSVIRPSVRLSVRKLKFLGNRCMDPGQILWEATYPPYLQTIFLFFQNFQFSNFYDFFRFC